MKNLFVFLLVAGTISTIQAKPLINLGLKSLLFKPLVDFSKEISREDFDDYPRASVKLHVKLPDPFHELFDDDNRLSLPALLKLPFYGLKPMKEFFDDIGEDIGDGLLDMLESKERIGEKIFDSVQDFLEGVFDAAEEFEGFFDKAEIFSDDAFDFFEETGEKVFNVLEDIVERKFDKFDSQEKIEDIVEEIVEAPLEILENVKEPLTEVVS